MKGWSDVRAIQLLRSKINCLVLLILAKKSKLLRKCKRKKGVWVERVRGRYRDISLTGLYLAGLVRYACTAAAAQHKPHRLV